MKLLLLLNLDGIYFGSVIKIYINQIGDPHQMAYGRV